MIPSLPTGTYVAVVTPFTLDGRIDFSALDRLIERQLTARVDALVMLGTTGESPTVSASEFSAILRHAIAQAGQSTAVIAGVGSNNTAATQQQADVAATLGVDGLLVVCPYYSKPTGTGLYEHFRTIAEAVQLPQLVYNIAGRTGVNIDTNTLARLAELPAVAGVKEASDNITQVSDVLQRMPADFLVLSGCDHLNFTTLCLGGHGVVSTVANLVPEQVKAMVDAVQSDDIISARKLHAELHNLVSSCALETNPIPVKTALAMMGDIQETFRLPLCHMNPENKTTLQRTLEYQGLLSPASSAVPVAALEAE